MGTIRKFAKCDSGATAIEYGLIVSAVGLAIAAGLSHFGGELSSNFNAASGKIADTVNKVEPAAGN